MKIQDTEFLDLLSEETKGKIGYIQYMKQCYIFSIQTKQVEFSQDDELLFVVWWHGFHSAKEKADCMTEVTDAWEKVGGTHIFHSHGGSAWNNRENINKE